MGVKKKAGGVVKRKGTSEKGSLVAGPVPRFTAKSLGAALSKFCATRPDARLYVGGDPGRGYVVAHGHAAVLVGLKGEFEEVTFKVPRTKLTVELNGKRKFTPLRIPTMGDEFVDDRGASSGVKMCFDDFFEPARKFKREVHLLATGGGGVVCGLVPRSGGNSPRLCYAVTSHEWKNVGLLQAKYLDAVLALAGESVFEPGRRDDGLSWMMTAGWDEYPHIIGKEVSRDSRGKGFHVLVSDGDLRVRGYVMPFEAGRDLAAAAGMLR